MVRATGVTSLRALAKGKKKGKFLRHDCKLSFHSFAPTPPPPPPLPPEHQKEHFHIVRKRAFRTPKNCAPGKTVETKLMFQFYLKVKKECFGISCGKLRPFIQD